MFCPPGLFRRRRRQDRGQREEKKVELKELEYFVVCAENGSCGKAAERLFTSQANVSKTIRRLEEELGYPLFHRRSTGIVLTADGEALYGEAKSILEKTARIGNRRASVQEGLAIASNPSNFLAGRFVNFSQRQSGDKRFSFTEGSTEEVLECVSDERAELGFVYIEESRKNGMPWLLSRRRLRFQKLADAVLVLCVGPNSPLFTCEKLTPELLRAQKYTCLYDDAFSRSYPLQRVVRELGLTANMECALQTNSEHVARHILEETDRACVFESAIDALSYLSILKLRGHDWRRANCLSLGGVCPPRKNGESKFPMALGQYLKDNPNIETVVLCLDSDAPGRSAAAAIKTQLSAYAVIDNPPRDGKDYNDLLQKLTGAAGRNRTRGEAR